jgi:hypothetical protein
MLGSLLLAYEISWNVVQETLFGGSFDANLKKYSPEIAVQACECSRDLVAKLRKASQCKLTGTPIIFDKRGRESKFDATKSS